MKPFYKEIECEHGWTDELKWDRCQLGSALGDDGGCYCGKEHCLIYEENEEDIELDMELEEI